VLAICRLLNVLAFALAHTFPHLQCNYSSQL